MKKRVLITIFTVCISSLFAGVPVELRAAKITNLDIRIMFSDHNIADGMAYLDSININTVLVCVWNSNGANGDYTLYPS
ncbi:MAG: hypothetical protein JXR21_01105, partial [Candidatus Marinimicrobia bacterium]|nr:hypothetical protein [Candidatus Neomarinimicrobiota bacterium]